MTLDTVRSTPLYRRLPVISWFLRGSGSRRAQDHSLKRELRRLQLERSLAVVERDQAVYRLRQVTAHRDELQRDLDLALAANEANRVRHSVPAPAGPATEVPTYEFYDGPALGTWTPADDEAAWGAATSVYEDEIVHAELVEDDAPTSVEASELFVPVPPMPTHAPTAPTTHSYVRTPGVTAVTTLSAASLSPTGTALVLRR